MMNLDKKAQKVIIANNDFWVNNTSSYERQTGRFVVEVGMRRMTTYKGRYIVNLRKITIFTAHTTAIHPAWSYYIPFDDFKRDVMRLKSHML